MAGGDGIFTYRHGIAVAQLAIFTVSLAAAAYFKYCHRNGWFCIGVFSIFRLVGAGCMLGTITNDADSVWAGVFVCESFGMVLIVFLLLELLLRANRALPTIHSRWFFYPQVLTWADLGLAVGGFMAATKNEHSLAPTKYTQASFGIFGGLYLIVVYIFWCFWRCRSTFARDEKLAIHCVGACLPLLAVRTAYSIIYQITADRMWNAVKGNPTPYLLMTFLPEAFIIFASVWTIATISPPPRKPSKKDNKLQDPEQGYALVDRTGSSGEIGREQTSPGYTPALHPT